MTAPLLQQLCLLTPIAPPEVTAAIGVSAAIAVSDIPWDGPISSVNVGLVDGEIVLNPTLEQREKQI